MTPDERVVAHHLLCVWEVYGKFEHQCSQTGEQAMDWLHERGLVIDTGWGVEPTATGHALMAEDHSGYGVI